MSEIEDTLYRLDLRELAIPLDRCIVARVGEVEPSIIQALIANGYDQAPVLDPQGRPIGIVPTSALQQIQSEGTPLLPNDSTIERARLPADVELDDFLDLLSRNRALLVQIGPDSFSLLTISDLNKHPLRSLLYEIFADLEVSLAAFIAGRCLDPQEWIPHLSEDQQVQVLGFWEVTRRSGVDIDPLSACTLSNLISILTSNGRMMTTLGYNSKSHAQSVLGRLPKLRNKVMHPVRPLVLSSGDVSNIRETIQRVKDMQRRLKGERGQRGPGPPD